MSRRPLGPILGTWHALACLAASIRLRTAYTRARWWAALAVLALDRSRDALATARDGPR